MDKSKRAVVIAGNWKMNKTAKETSELLSQMVKEIQPNDCKVVICVPAINIPCAVKETQNTFINIGAQNCHWEANGAFTGEISAQMLQDFAVKYAIIGHSERRQYFGETDKTVNQRTIACLNADITPIVCVGENLEQRETNVTNDIIKTQITNGLANITAQQLKNIIIAYEPVWAIGTGKTATAEQAEEVCCYIRKILSEMFCEDCANAVTIQYGGSMNASNAKELLTMPNIDGGLIGGASLKAADFAAIVAAAK